LLSIKPGDIDILVTHDSPYETGVGFTGEVQGSRKITTLLEAMQPKYLIAGHYHHAIDLQNIGATKYLGLNILIPPMRKDKKGCVQQGSMATFDTDNGVLEFVRNDCFSQIDREFDFRAFVRELRRL
jgi:Icc-related predicted phosphoesterase